MHVVVDEEQVEQVRTSWQQWQQQVAADEATHLLIIESPYRSLLRPILAHIDALRLRHPEETLTVIVPEFVVAHWWEFALPYIQQPTLIRDHINTMREQVDCKDRSQALEVRLAEIKEKIINLLAVAEGARDETTRQLYRERLATLERDMRDTELLLTRLTNTTERSQKLLIALDKFEAWAISQQPLLADPTYEVTKEDKRAALIILGVKATVWPTEGYPERVQFQLCPPDIQRFCDFFFQ